MKLKFLTPQEKKRHRLDCPRCPYCGHWDLEFGDTNWRWGRLDASGCYQAVQCNACLRTWYEYYELKDIVEEYPLCVFCEKVIREDQEAAFRPDKGYAHATCVQEHWITKEST